MQCEQARKRLHELADRRSVTMLPADLEEHLHTCAECRHLQGVLAALETLFGHRTEAGIAAPDMPATSDIPHDTARATSEPHDAWVEFPPVDASGPLETPPAARTFAAGVPGDTPDVSVDFLERLWRVLRHDREADTGLRPSARVPAPAAPGRTTVTAASAPAGSGRAHRLAACVTAIALTLAALALLPERPAGPAVTRQAATGNHSDEPLRPEPPPVPDRSILNAAPRAALVAASLSADAGLRIAESTQRVPAELGRRLARSVLTLPVLFEDAAFDGDPLRSGSEAGTPSGPGSDAEPPLPLRPLLQLFDSRG